MRWVRSSEIRVRWAPSEARTRRVSSTISPRIASASRIAVTRAAISRRVRSVSARREVSSRDRPSSRISSALWMAIVARSARAARSAPSCSLNRPDLAREHRERAQHHGLADQRRERDRPDADPVEELAVRRAVGEAVVGGVLRGDDDAALADREVDARSADAQRLPLGPGRLVHARVVRPVDLARGRVEEVDDRARRAEQPGGLVDDVLEQLGRVLDRHHPPRDLAQRALRVGRPLEGALRRGEAVDEAGVGERDRGLAGQRVEQPERVLPERVAVAVARLEHADEAVLADDGRRDDRVQVDLLHAFVAFLVVLEPPVGHVVTGRHGPALADGEPGQADRLLVVGRVEHRRVGEQAVLGVGPDHLALDRLDEVEAGALGAQQPGGLVDDAQEEVAGVAADGREPAADLAQRPLLLGPPGEGLAGPAQLLDQARAPERDRRLARDGLQQGGVVGPEGVDAGRPDRDRPERPLVAVERRRDDAVDALRPHVRVRPVPVDEVRVLEVVARDVGLAGHHGAPRRPDLERVVRVPRPLGLEDLLVARREQALEQPRLGVDDVDPGAVAVEQAEGLVDRELDHRLGVPSAGDAGAELAQRPLDHRLALAGLARAVELGDEPGVGHRERGVLGEGADERDLGRGERVGAARERAQRPEDLRPGDQGRDDERPQPDLVDEPVRALRVAGTSDPRRSPP